VAKRHGHGDEGAAAVRAGVDNRTWHHAR
jgi:hypothetical protein